MRIRCSPYRSRRAGGLAPFMLALRSCRGAGRSRHRDLHRREDHGAAHQLPAEQRRFPAEDDCKTQHPITSRSWTPPTARSKASRARSPACRRSSTISSWRRRRRPRIRRRRRSRRPRMHRKMGEMIAVRPFRGARHARTRISRFSDVQFAHRIRCSASPRNDVRGASSSRPTSTGPTAPSSRPEAHHLQLLEAGRNRSGWS